MLSVLLFYRSNNVYNRDKEKAVNVCFKQGYETKKWCEDQNSAPFRKKA